MGSCAHSLFFHVSKMLFMMTSAVAPENFNIFELRCVSYVNGLQVPVSDISCTANEAWSLYVLIEQVRAEEHEKKVFMAMRDSILRAAGIGKPKATSTNRRFSADIYKSIGKAKGSIGSGHEAEERKIVTGYWTGISMEDEEIDTQSPSPLQVASQCDAKAPSLTDEQDEADSASEFESGEEESEEEKELLLHIKNVIHPTFSSPSSSSSLSANLDPDATYPNKPRKRLHSKKSTLVPSLPSNEASRVKDNHPLFFESERRKLRKSTVRGKHDAS